MREAVAKLYTYLVTYPRRRAPGAHWVGGWVDPRAGLDEMEKLKFLTLPGPLTRTPQSSSP
jgi:hypothetical protein